MPATKKLLLLAGDGIGPEVMDQVLRVIDWLDRSGSLVFDVECGLLGGAAFEVEGVPLTEATMRRAKAVDAVLVGACGGPNWETLPFDLRPGRGLMRLRSELGLFANLRAARVYPALVGASSLKPDLVNGVDIMIVRELTGGIYFGTPRGIEILPNGERRGLNTQSYTTSEIERVARVALDLARARRKNICSVDMANLMESGLLWRETIQATRDRDYGDVRLTHMYANECAMHLVRAPKQFDVIVTDNLFGDLLSDCAAMLTGSLGMLPSASLGAVDPAGLRPALYEPVHGSAPDIAGQGKANPLASILSFAMMLRYSFHAEEQAAVIERAVGSVLDKGIRTADICRGDQSPVSTGEMGSAIIAELNAGI